jgi:hypothetical protein
MIDLAISPLELDPLTRPYYGFWDAYAIAQLAPLADEDCYQPKFYKAPASSDEIIAPGGYASYGLKITPGSLIYAFFLPALLATGAPPQFNVQIQDVSLKHYFWDQAVPSFFLGNFKPTYLSANPLDATGAAGSFPNLWPAVHPVTGSGVFLVELWVPPEATEAQRVELVFGVLEVVG